MKVWIDQDNCTGSGLCERIDPSVFALDEEGLGVVRAGDAILPAGRAGVATVSPGSEREVLEASQSCPGGCIHVEPE